MPLGLGNWARNLEYGAANVHRPATGEEVQAIVAGSRRVKALGTRHAFSEIADTDGDLIQLDRFNDISPVDTTERTVRIGAGVTYGQLCPALQSQGFAVANLASLPHLSVVGASATGTHGSGIHNRCLSAAVSGLEFVAANGSVLHKTRKADPQTFPGLVVGLGAFGVVTALTLEVVSTFDVQQDVYEDLPLDSLEAHFEEIEAAAYSVSLFTDWRSETIDQLWLKRVVPPGECLPRPSGFFGAKQATRPHHPIAGLPTEACTDQLGSVGPWLDRLPHFRLEFTPSAGEELQTEYLMPRRLAIEAIRAVRTLRDRISPLLLTTEIRTIAADDLWLSPAYARDSVAIHFTWRKMPEAVWALLPAIEAVLEPFDPRPHWGKLSTMSHARLDQTCEKMEAFRNLVADLDPEGKFRNRFLEVAIGV